MHTDHKAEADRHAETAKILTRRARRATAGSDQLTAMVRFHEAAAALHAFHATPQKKAQPHDC